MGTLHRFTLTAAAVALMLAACTDNRPTAQDAAETLAKGLTALDVSGSVFTTATPEAVNEELAEITAGLEPLAPQVSVTSVEPAGDNGDEATAELLHLWDIDESDEDWTYTTTVQLNRVEDEWQAVWSPGVAVADLAEGETLSLASVPAQRGEILGADGAVLVTDRPVIRVGIDKTTVEEPELASSAAALAELVGIDPEAFAEQVSGAGPEAFVQAIVYRDDGSRPVSDEELEGIPGARGITGTQALAPTRTFARELLGTVGEATGDMIAESDGRLAAGDIAGLSGLQLQHDAQLRGTPGRTVSALPPEGEERILFERDPVPGEALQTTIDPDLQALAEEALTVEPSASAIVALRPSSGEILTAANGPGSGGLQTALLGQYPPGSTFKVATSLALLRQGLTPESPTQCTPEFEVDGRTFNNASTYPAEFLGEIPLLQTFAQSCNTGFISNSDVVSQEDLAAAAADLGIGVDAGIGLPAFFGSVPAEADGTAHAASMIGQGEVLVSPLALAVMAASVGAGERVTPTLLAGGKAEAGADPTENPTEAGASPSSAEAGDTAEPTGSAEAEPSALTAEEAATLRELMRAVVTDGGANQLADVPGEPVLAKTGTAEFGSNVPPSTHAWIVALQGDLAVAVFVEEGELGSTTGGPLMEEFLRGAVG